jgi:hypothetical protein
MRNIRTDKINPTAGPAHKDTLTTVENPLLARVMAERRKHLRGLLPLDTHKLVKEITRDVKVIIVEGIPGSGKDTFQAYLRQTLAGRDLYDYSEGELLHSWKHVPIKGILQLRVKFIKLFVHYLTQIVTEQDNSTFILNRLHLSTYVSTILKQPNLEREYDEIVNAIRKLPVHIFILQLDENEIERRSAHSERSSSWRNYQQQRVGQDGFTDTVKRYIWQQNLIVELAKKQLIPYSLIKLSSATSIDGHSVATGSSLRRGLQPNSIPTIGK